MNEQNQQTANEANRDANPTIAASQTGESKVGPCHHHHGNLAVADEEGAEAALPLADLAPQGEVNGAGNQGWGKWEVNLNNHNETIVGDEEEKTTVAEPIADLPLTDEQQVEIKGGKTEQTRQISVIQDM